MLAIPARFELHAFQERRLQTVDPESAYEVLQRRVKETGSTSVPPTGARAPTGTGAPAGTGAPDAPSEASTGGGILGNIGNVLGGLFGTNRPRGQRLSTGQLVAREVTRSVTNKVAGGIAADLGKSLGGKVGGSVGRAIVRGALGGILRR